MAFKKELKLYAYIVMPNHLHVLVQPIENGISKTMQLLKGRSSRKINILREAKASRAPEYKIKYGEVFYT